ncbi:hypothetical protein PM082_006129 [Marasmius tenuissimus]|nr:hypothetical protein PM082_006129 [Marasmius tenuissimus]
MKYCIQRTGGPKDIYRTRTELEEPERAWLFQASSIFHSLGISLEGDLSVYQYVHRQVILDGDLDYSPSKTLRRLQQPIYLFVHPPPLDLPTGLTSSLHFWSLHEDGRSQLLPESCDDLGLPSELQCSNNGFQSCSWSTNDYRRLYEYQFSPGFDPKTIDFARHLGYDGLIFQPVNNSDRFGEVPEEQKYSGLSESNVNADLEDPLNTQDLQSVGSILL